MADKMSNQLFLLRLACITHEKQVAIWVYNAVCAYVYTGRNSIEFDKAFCKLTDKRLVKLIDYCLNRDQSDAGIMESVKKYCKVA